MQIDLQSSKDLEFNVVCELLSNYCKSQKAKENATKINYFDDLNSLQKELNLIEEIKIIHESENTSFPHPNSEDIDHALKILRIENGVLILHELIKVYNLCISTKHLIDFAEKHKNEAPLVFEACSHINQIDVVLKMICEVLDEKKLDIKDDATPQLLKIRTNQKSNWNALNRNFERVLRKYKQDNIIGEVEEAFLDNKRVLSVFSQYKKRVSGRVIGSSAKGTYTYIEPSENIELNKSQEKLLLEEKNELFKILEKLTFQLRGEKKNLSAFQRLLVRFDLLNAKVIFAQSYGGIKPKINKERNMYWQNAKHPLLLLKNKSLNLPTFGQEIHLNESQKFLIISGPNAGGKSITLKTVGLLQMMLQSGLYVPVDDVSEFCWFEKVLSDIGDNQSIENQLSTYSYRLQRMKFFLDDANDNTLLLLDEFGSGSDPELGGAMAEVFYEELYHKNLFAVITTHYTNIKVLTSSLPNAVNACMLFDTKELKPLYQLSIGQPGSSFTFEVAKYNGIDNELIQRAKEKVSESKINFDNLTVDLQIEKSKLKKISSQQFQSNATAQKMIRDFETKLEKLNDKYERHTQYFEQNNKFITTGKKIYDLIKKYKTHKTNKALNEEVKKFIAMEKSKILEQEKPLVFAKPITLPDLPKIKKKKSTEKPIIPLPEKPQKEYKVGDLVKIKNQTSKGTIEEIKGKKITVLIGNFRFTTQLSEIE